MASAAGIAVLLFIFSCHAVGLLLFCKGFQLNRVVIPEYTPCHVPNENDPALIVNSRPDIGPSCSQYPRPYKRVVWLLVDALRYDFALYDENLQPSPPVYRNKLPFIRDLLKNRPQNAKLFKFIADPPTTTMQRLKALTTGSLPTFIDVSSNFNSYEILEDNLLHQASTNGRNITFIGDDTWLGLYPDTFTKVFPYPSLNVKDLHSVDDGVTAHMVPELVKGDAELVIGHFLGVDHVGHTYGPSHWTMGEKLTQMNDVLESVCGAVGEDSVVFVLGDHGMTSTGDHGGETQLETEAALLVYSPTPLFHPKMPSGRSVYQIDLVPTIALLLGIPIPFSSLGMIIPEVFIPFREDLDSMNANQSIADGFSGRVTLEFLSALRINANQLQKYLNTYTQYSSDLPSGIFHSLERELANALQLHEKIEINKQVSQTELSQAASVYVNYMQSVKSMCQKVWAKFDDVPIHQGLLLLLLSVATTPLLLFKLHHSSHDFVRKALKTGCIVGGVLAPLLSAANSSWEVSLSSLFSFLGLFAFLVLLSANLISLWQVKRVFSAAGVLRSLLKLDLLQVFSATVIVVHAVCLLSNSFVVFEGDVVSFFLQTLMVLFAVRTLRHKFKLEELDSQSPSVWKVLACVGPHLGVMLCIRATKIFYTCRDPEQNSGCEATSFIHALPMATEALGALSKWRFLASSLSLACVPLALAIFLWRSREARRYINGWLVALVCFGFPLCVVCVVGFWAIQALPQSTLRSLPNWQHVTLPRTVYVTCGAVVVLAIVKPFRLRRAFVVHDAPSSVQDAEPVNTSVRQRRVPLTTGSVRNTQLPTGCALEASHHRSSVLTVFLILIVAVWIPVAMLLNDGLALSAVVMVAQVTLFVCAIRTSEEGSSWQVCVFWALMSCQYFFAFGHHTTVTSLRFEAAFVGIHGEIVGANLPLAAMLVGINTLASQLLYSLGLPVLLYMQSSDGRLSSHEKLVEISLKYIAVHSIKMLVSVFAASLHRRHLMVWAVFTPRFMYEAAFQITTDLGTILTLTLHRRLAHKAAAI